MKLQAIIKVFIALLLVINSACLKFQFITVDERTQLEAQILGNLAEIERGAVLDASVRTTAAQTTELPSAQREVVRAALVREYNKDDLAMLKDKGCVVELKSGFVKAHKCNAAWQNQTIKTLLTKIVAEENEARRTIFEYVIARNPELSAKDLPKVGAIFWQLQLEIAKPEHLFEDEKGNIKPKKDF